MSEGNKTSESSLFKLILNSPNFSLSDERMSRAAAFLIGFYILHSIPNTMLLLPSGELQYDSKARSMQQIPGLALFEIYLALGFIVHASLAIKSASEKPVSVLLVSGLLVSGFTILHLLDFRLGNFQKPSEPPHAVVESVLRNRARKAIYVLGVALACIHAYQGLRPAFLFKLGFRGERIKWLQLIGRALVVLSTANYFIPLAKW